MRAPCREWSRTDYVRGAYISFPVVEVKQFCDELRKPAPDAVTRRACERIEQLNALPIAGTLMAAPYYIRPSQAGIVGHFMALADASDKPVVLYDIPYRTGVRLELDTLLTLAAHPRIQASRHPRIHASTHPRIQAVKDCAGSLETTLALIRDGRLQVLTGEDINIFNTLCLGGSGAIAASAHLRPERFVALYRALSAGRLDEGRRIFHELAPLIQALFAEPNPAPVKALLAAHGLIRDELRMPMTRAGDALVARLRELEGLDRIAQHAAALSA
ncbi:dihydrodipicolinate synthase family protein [Paraburkholderia sp. GAS348]|uniref:dihydrodipicolinate synthase family protein n=1 Tax=Paraburkholderia sp. GAS348 TaxID=3035132 RepID=UPI003D208B97